MEMDPQTRSAMQQIAEAAADRAVSRTLLSLGIDQGNPLGAQRDMVALRELRLLVDDEEFQLDMLHLRRWRKTMDSVEKRGVLAAVGLVCFGGLALIVYAFRVKLFGQP